MKQCVNCSTTIDLGWKRTEGWFCDNCVQSTDSLHLSGVDYGLRYNPTLKKWFTSRSAEEKAARSFSDEQHPDGFGYVRDDYKFMRELKYINRHKEEVRIATQPGYRAGDKGKYDSNKPDALHHRGRVFSFGK